MMADLKKRCDMKKNKAGAVTRPRIPIEFNFEQLLGWFVSQQSKPGVWTCGYCQRPLVLTDVQIDHDVPLVRGGAAALYNQVVACKLCNQTKGELTGVEFLALMGLLRSLGWAAESYVTTALRMVGIAKRQRFFPRTPKPATASVPLTQTPPRRR